MRVAITGSSGYVGSHLVRFLEGKGCEVVALARKSNGGVPAWELGIEPELQGVDVLVHCAHSFGSAALNIDGTRTLYAAAARAGVSFIVFVSSMAAFPGCKSIYGQTKLEIEADTSKVRGVSLRPGTIWGGAGGGLMRSLENLVRKLPVLPLIGVGGQRLFLVNIDDLSELIHRAMLNREELRSRVFSVAHRDPLTFREALSVTAARLGLRRLMVPIPALLILMGLRLGERLGIELPLRSDSVRSLTAANSKPDLSLPPCLDVELRPYR